MTYQLWMIRKVKDPEPDWEDCGRTRHLAVALAGAIHHLVRGRSVAIFRVAP